MCLLILFKHVPCYGNCLKLDEKREFNTLRTESPVTMKKQYFFTLLTIKNNEQMLR